MSLGEILFSGDGIDCCADRPWVEIAWDQWTRTRIFCKHGVFEGISDFMDLEQGVQRARASFDASLTTGVHYGCHADCLPPVEWVKEGSWKAGDMTDCEMVRGHDGDHCCFPDDESEAAYWRERRVYFINGHDVTGQREIPKAIGALP